MDWVDEGGTAPEGRGATGDGWREARGDFRANRRALDERLEGWVSRGRELVDGVSGARPGSRPPGRGGERSGVGGRGALDGVGRWVEGKLDWLLDDRDDWQEPWQEAERPASRRGATAERGERWQPAASDAGEENSPAFRRSRTPLEAISRRGASPAERPRHQPSPAPPRATPPWPEPEGSEARGATSGTSARQNATTSQDWPEEDSFTVPRWRRQDSPAPKPVDPLAPAAAPAPSPGRPLPRSTRRR